MTTLDHPRVEELLPPGLFPLVTGVELRVIFDPTVLPLGETLDRVIKLKDQMVRKNSKGRLPFLPSSLETWAFNLLSCLGGDVVWTLQDILEITGRIMSVSPILDLGKCMIEGRGKWSCLPLMIRLLTKGSLETLKLCEWGRKTCRASISPCFS